MVEVLVLVVLLVVPDVLVFVVDVSVLRVNEIPSPDVLITIASLMSVLSKEDSSAALM